MTKTKECRRKIKAFVFSFSLRIPDPHVLLKSPRPLSPPQGHWTSYQLARNWLSHCPRDPQESFQHHDSKASVLQHSAFFMVELSHTELDHKRIGKEIRWLDKKNKGEEEESKECEGFKLALRIFFKKFRCEEYGLWLLAETKEMSSLILDIWT